jgi:hypothetical protein
VERVPSGEIEDRLPPLEEIEDRWTRLVGERKRKINI